MENKIRACGEIRLDLNLIYYPLGDYWYAVNSGGTRSITKAIPILEEIEGKTKRKPRTKYWVLRLSEIEEYVFEDTPIGKDMPYNNPISLKDAHRWFDEDIKVDIDEVYNEIKKVLNECYDFNDEKDIDIATLFILQSWFCDILNAVFYVDVRSQMGGGKTILLELMQGLSRYGVLANDMSFAVIPRIIDRYKCTLFFDEIDMINKHVKDDIFKIIRTGYRRGQKYIRAKPKTFEPETFDCYGAKAFNYRSDVADDLKNRSLPINTSKSKDKVLPIINLYKERFLKPIAFKIFCFYMGSLSRLVEVSKIFDKDMNEARDADLVNEVKEVNRVIVNTNTDIYKSIPNYPLFRKTFFVHHSHFALTSFTLFTKNHFFGNLSEEEAEKYMYKLFEKLSGRSIEIFTLIINLCIYLGLEIFQNFKEILEEKADFEDLDEEDLKNTLREILVSFWEIARVHEHSALKYSYYREVQREFIRKVHETYGFKPNAGDLKRYLRELGFVDKKNKKIVKFGDNVVLCLLFDDNAKRSLGIPLEEVIPKKE
jgi:hypothetical protein